MSIKDICNAINALFSTTRTPAPEIPSVLMTFACPSKPGLSTLTSVSNIVTDLNKHGIPTDPMPDGSENKTVVIVSAIVDEIYRAMREDANIQTSYGPGAITIMAAGANAGGPVISQGINTNFSKGQSIIQ